MPGSRRLLHCKVILVTSAGIGRPIDEAAVNKALFDKENVEVIGAVMNKVLPDKLESITDIARRGFERLGLELLGVIPRENMLEQSTLERICERHQRLFSASRQTRRNRVAHVRIGAMSSANVFRGVKENTLLVVPGDRENIVLTVLNHAARAESPFCGIVLSDDIQAQRGFESGGEGIVAAGRQFAAGQLFHREPDPFHERENVARRCRKDRSHPETRQRPSERLPDPGKNRLFVVA